MTSTSTSSALTLALVLVSALSISIPVEAKIEYWYVGADFHYDSQYDVGAPSQCWLAGKVGLHCCRKYDIPVKGSVPASKWGEYHCDTPIELIRYVMNQTRSQLFRQFPPTRYLWLGDTADHHDLTQSFEKNMGEISQVTAVLQDVFEGIEVIPLIGNHDTWPIDQLAPPKDGKTKLTETLLQMWKNWIPEDQVKNFINGGYYEKQLVPGLKALIVNSLYGEKLNLEILFSKDPSGQYAWLKERFENATKSGDKVILLGHIPPADEEATKTYTESLVSLAQEYSETILYQMWAHTHQDTFGLILDPSQTQVVNSFLVHPSLMPDNHDPALRIIAFETETNEIVNYYQYHFNMTTQWETNEAKWELLYDFNSEYGLSGVDHKSLSTLYQQLKKQPSLFRQYYTNRYVGTVHPCDMSCTNTTLTSMVLH